MRKGFFGALSAVFLTVLFLFVLPVSACALEMSSVPRELNPGRTERFSFRTEDAEHPVTVTLTRDGETVGEMQEGLQVISGTNHFTWDGCFAGKPVLPGDYEIILRQGEQQAAYSVVIGGEAIRILRVSAPDALVSGSVCEIRVDCSMPGQITLIIKTPSGLSVTLPPQKAASGQNTAVWDGTIEGKAPEAGRYTLQILCESDEGIAGTPRQIMLNVTAASTPTPTPAPTPSPTPYYPSTALKSEEPLSYWSLPIGVMNEEAIWQVMMQPMTVVTGNQKDTYKLRATPDKAGGKNIIGEITCASQGVHVLETLDSGWTKVEVYNSSYGPDCESRRGYGDTDALLQGYVETDRLETLNPSEKYGLLIDKLEQKMYIFENGKVIGSLLVSTGQPTKAQPWNETPSGEYMMVSFVGGFAAGNLYCAYGMRVNGGCLIHEVPYIGTPETEAERRDYSSTIPKLGSKASHGCIRVQKAANETGQNMLWLWRNLEKQTKVLIWDDSGRKIPYPDENTVIYYNPTGGVYFHQDQNCSSVRARYLPLAESTYGALQELFKDPKPCPHCCKLKTKAEIDALNEAIQ